MRRSLANLNPDHVKRALIRLARTQEIVSPAPDVQDDEVLPILRELLDYVDGFEPRKGAPALVVPDDRFSTKLVGDAGATRIALLRSSFTLNGRTVEEACGPGRYKALALTALEEACMWAIKSVTHEPATDSGKVVRATL